MLRKRGALAATGDYIICLDGGFLRRLAGFAETDSGTKDSSAMRTIGKWVMTAVVAFAMDFLRPGALAASFACWWAPVAALAALPWRRFRHPGPGDR
jgi:hypothetical protein